MDHPQPDKTPTEQSTQSATINFSQNDKAQKTKRGAIEPTEQTQQSYNWRNLKSISCYESINIIIMILIFLVTAIYACFAGLQWLILRKQVAQTNDIIKITGDQFKLDQRAWIGLVGGRLISGKIEAGKPIIIAIEFKNTGKTPAYDFSSLSTISFNKFPLTSDLPSIIPAHNFLSKAIIFPGGKNVQSIKINALTAEQVEMLNTGTHAIYVHGEVHYKDAFGKDRFTKFNYFHNMFTGNDNSTTAYMKGNEAN